MRTIIKNKEESSKYIKEKQLNHFGEKIYERGNFAGVEKFLKKYQVEYYFLRELKTATKNIFYELTAEEVLSKVELFDKFGSDVSSLNYFENIKLCAEVMYCKNGSFLFLGSTNRESTHRNFLKPNYFIKTDIFDKKVKQIPYIDEIIDYIYKHSLFDLIIELVVFDIPVGVNNEKIIIYEIRTDY